ncbi:MAG: sulfite exporter TauE/SafE family protein [Myxococcota bacterium]
MTGVALDVLLVSTLTVAAVHTVVGVDHVIPFVALGRGERWSLRRTLGVTALCGVGHVLSSVLLGVLGVAIGLSAERLAWVEAIRGDTAAWMLVALGAVWAAWGFSHARRRLRRPEGDHDHHGPGPVGHGAWAIFLVFVFGPCEPLIPLMMAPAVGHDWGAVGLVVGTFTVTTVGLMLALVAVAYVGAGLPSFPAARRHVHVLVGLTLSATGLAIRFLGI